jgi:hypothetical protein
MNKLAQKDVRFAQTRVSPKMKSLLSAFLVAIIICGLILASGMSFCTAQAPTEVIGIIRSNITFTKANSPYVFTGPVVVDTNARLTIEAGVTIDLNDNYLEIDGTLMQKVTVPTGYTSKMAQ